MRIHKPFLGLLFCSTFLGAPHIDYGSDKVSYVFSVTRSYAAEVSEVQLREAKSFITHISDHGIGFLSDDKLTEDQRKKEFRTLLNNNFDMNTIARFAMGRHWRTASKAQKREYVDLFRVMIVDVYSRRFKDYNGQALNVYDARAQGRDVFVSSKILPDEGPAISVDWRVRKKDGKYKVVDILVEGVSMALTQRSDFSSVIQRGGGNVDVLIAHLKK